MASDHTYLLWIFWCVNIVIIRLTSAVCPADWLNITTGDVPNQACYKIFSSQTNTFDAAATFCQSLDGYLARDTSQTVHDTLQQYVVDAAKATATTAFWIGLTDNNVTNGPWQWVGGPVLGSYQNFGSSFTPTPNRKHCVYISAIDSNMRWQVTSDCSKLFSFICQRDVTVSSTVSMTQPPLYCPSGWTSFLAQQTCIMLYTSRLQMWPDARNICQQQLKGDLVKIGNSALNNFVNTLIIAQQAIYWIGLNYRVRDGQFVWLDEADPANFTNWDSNMPNNEDGKENCVAIDGYNNLKWDNGNCNNNIRFICQRSPISGTPTATTSSTQSNMNCGAGWEDVPNSDSCLKFNTNVLTWMDAQEDCRSAGGDLASVVSVQEQFYLVGRSVAFTSGIFWIGANDRSTEGGWQWTDGSPFAFINWDARQPDNSLDSDCVALIQHTGRWDDLPCQDRYSYICKKKGKVTLPSLLTTSTTPGHLPGDVIFGCPVGWSSYLGSCYKPVLSSTGQDWITASSSCSDPILSGALAAILDDEENKFILSLIPNNYTDTAWIGLQDPVKNTFSWVDGTPVLYTNWNPGEPNNNNNKDCVVMKSDNGKWSVAQCSNLVKLFICKKNKSVLPVADTSQNQGCQIDTLGYGAHCYNFIISGKNFTDAQKDCRAISGNSGNLATIDSGHLQAFLSAQLVTQPGSTYWIGLSQSGDSYVWQSNWPVSFTYWGKNHTGNERHTCVAMMQTSPAGLWSNYLCWTLLPYVCESPRTGFSTQTTRTTITRQQPCPAGWTGYGRYCYLAFQNATENRLSWTGARDYCASQAVGGSLVIITDNTTQSWLLTNILKPVGAVGSFWIGLNDRESEAGYVWTDNSPLLFTNWAPNEPNDDLNREDCVEWDMNKNAWNDQYCYLSNNWICQVPRGSIITTVKPSPTGSTSLLCGGATWMLYNNFCYLVSSSNEDSSLVSWFQARQSCLDFGADLTSIGGDDENGFITTLISKSPINSFWTGLNDLDMDTYGWTDLSPIGYVAWALNEPNDNYGEERCVEINSLGSWNDAHCQSKFGYICKKRPGDFTSNPVMPMIPTGGCPVDFTTLPSLSFCYFVGGATNTTRKNYTDAMAACEQKVHRSTLASIHNPQEEKFILVLMSSLWLPAWIGLNDRMSRNQFMWVDNLNVSYTNWGPGQPDEDILDNSPGIRRDCVDVEITHNPGTWNDRQCGTALAYVCECRKDPSILTTAPDSTGCHPGYQRFRNSCYRYYGEYLNWTSAESICVADGGHLATLSSGIEQAYAEILTQADYVQFWIGLKYSMASSSFTWADGWPVRFTNWGKDEPNLEGNQTCGTHIVDGQWQLVTCRLELSFICEVNFGSPPPTGTFNISGRCPDSTWLHFSGSCYHIETLSPTSWAGGNAACASLGAVMASIHSENESLYLTNATGSLDKDVWIGLSKGQGTGFYWYDGTGTQFTNWGPGEPSDPDSYLHQDCVKIVSQYGTWADTDCSDQNAYICKMPEQRRPSWGQGATSPTNSPGSTTSKSFSTTFGRSSSFKNSSKLPNQSLNPSATTPSSSPGSRTSQSFSRTFGRSSQLPYQRSSQQATTGHSAQFQPTAAGASGKRDSGVGGGAVAGIVIGTLVLVVLVALMSFVVFRYYQGQSIFPFASQRPNSPNSEFNNASYSSSSSSKEDKINLTVDET